MARMSKLATLITSLNFQVQLKGLDRACLFGRFGISKRLPQANTIPDFQRGGCQAHLDGVRLQEEVQVRVLLLHEGEPTTKSWEQEKGSASKQIRGALVEPAQLSALMPFISLGQDAVRWGLLGLPPAQMA